MTSSHHCKHIVPVADGTSLLFPNFCEDLGINADALYEAAVVQMPWNNRRNEPYMKGGQLFVAHLDQDDDGRRASSSFLTHVSQCLNDVFGFQPNHVIGTQYSLSTDCIGPHSDQPSDLTPKSWIVNISLGDERDFVLRQRTPREQDAWLLKNDVSNEDVYVNYTGRSYERFTLNHGSAVFLSTTTNSRWTHEVLPAGCDPIYDSRISLVFRDTLKPWKN
jgi:alkylated DNA repair dioxygenase AlkB